PYRLRLRENSHALQAVSPLATLARGYALAFSLPGQRLIRVAETLQVGQRIDIRLHQGSLECEVVAIRHGQNPGLLD
ncbi:MAG: exodeoxyribonuclease VII large subunit, partial [Pseudomonadota bacterium]